MKHKSRSSKHCKHPKTRLRLPDLEFSRTAVLNSLSSVDGQRGYGHAIDEFVDSVTRALKKGDRVTLVCFGTFSVLQRKARNGRNPQTGGVLKIAARRVAKFSPGVELKKQVNKK